MADVRAFRARYYDTAKAGGIESLFAPPYDVISPSEQRELLEANPYNIVRLILPDDASAGSPAWQEEAGRRFARWKREGVFDSSPADSVYFYRQTFDLPGGRRLSRTALIALFKLEELGGDGIYPHERTFPGVTAEQLALLRSCAASFSQVFALFEDCPEYHAYLAERALPASRCLFLFTDGCGLEHELRELSDAGLILELRGLLDDRCVFIADGHHRYETSLAYRDERRAEAGTDAGTEEPWEFISMAFIGLNDPGLVLLPVHRLIRCDNPSPPDIPGLLQAHCALRAVEGSDRQGRVRLACGEVLANRDARPVFGLVTPEEVYLVEPLELDAALAELERGHSREWARLDVTVLHEVILRRYLGLKDPADPSRPFEVAYTVDLDEVISSTAGGAAGFLVRSPSLQDTWRIAELGEKMPHKSTYFYPKMPSGLVIYDHAAGQPQIS